MKLNPTQINLINENMEDRIFPCLKNIMEHAQTEASKEVCMYLILKAINSIDTVQYDELLINYLSDSKKNLWVRNLLISLNNLFQSNNDQHLFIKFIIDKRFYDRSIGITLDDWCLRCKTTITEKYHAEIHTTLHEVNSDLYTKILHIIKHEIKSNAAEASINSIKLNT